MSSRLPLTVPVLGESITEAVVGRWLKQVGDFVQLDETVIELETDKVTIEVNAPAQGTLESIDIPKGQTAKIGDILGYLNPKETTEIPARSTAELEKIQPIPTEIKNEPLPQTIPNGFQDMDSKIRSEHWSVDNYMKRGASTIFENQILKNEGYKSKTSSRLLFASYKNNWLDKELFFAMNKLSIVGMVAGLMFLGTLFFISGFLLALNLYVLPNHQLPTLAVAAVTPHRASPNALAATHKPTPARPATVPHQYSNVGGVVMTNPPHKPTQTPVQQYQSSYGQQPQPQVSYQPQPVQPQPVAPTPHPDARYVQQQPTVPVNNFYAADPQYAPAYAPPYQPAPNR